MAMPTELGAIGGIAGSVVIPIYAIDRSSHVFHRVATSSLYLQSVMGRLEQTTAKLTVTQKIQIAELDKLTTRQSKLPIIIAKENLALNKLTISRNRIIAQTGYETPEILKLKAAKEAKIAADEKEFADIEKTIAAKQADIAVTKKSIATHQIYTGIVEAAGITHEAINRILMLSAMSFAALIVPVMGAAMVIKDYQKELVNAASILDLNREGMYKMGTEAVKISGIYNKSATEVAKGLYHLACFSQGERVMGGDFKVHKVEEYDGSNGLIDSKGNPQIVKKYMKRIFGEETEEKLFSIKPRCLRPFKVTGNHPVLVVRGKFCKPSKINNLCKPSCNLREKSYCTKKYFEKYKSEWVRADNLKRGDILLYPKIKMEKKIDLSFEIRKISPFKPPKYLDEDFAFFLGLMMGDGWTQEKKYEGRMGCVFANKDTVNVKWFENYVKQLGYKCTKRLQKGCFSLSFCSMPLSKFIRKEIGINAENKRIPPFMFQAEGNIIKSFLKGYIASDGCLFLHKSNNDSPRVSLTTVSPHIAYFINLLASKIGVVFSIGFDDKEKNGRETKLMPNGYVCHLKDSYIISTENPKFINILLDTNFKSQIRHEKIWQDNNFVYLPISWIREEKYEGMVYNYETEDNTYLTGVIVHNSAGLKATEIQDFLTPSMQLAIATQADYAQSSKYLLQGMRAFNIELSRGTEIADIYTWIIQHSLVTWDKLGEGIKFAAPWFATTGQSISELAAAIGVLTDRGLEAGIAGRGLRQAMAEITKRGEVAGISIYDASGNIKKFSDIVFEFAEKFPKSEEAMTKAMENMGIRGATAFISLVMGADSYREKLEGLQGAGGTTARLAGYQMNSIAAQLDLLKNKILAPILLSSEFADKFQAMLGPIGDMFYTAEGEIGVLGEKIQTLLLRSLQAVIDIIGKGEFQEFIGNLLETMVLMVPVWLAWSNILLLIVKILNSLGPGGLQVLIIFYALNKVIPIQTIMVSQLTVAWKMAAISLSMFVAGLMLYGAAANDAQRASAIIMTSMLMLIPVLYKFAAAKMTSWAALTGPAAPATIALITAGIVAGVAAIGYAMSAPTAEHGAYVAKGGLAELHPRETVIPAGESVSHSPTIIFQNVGMDEVLAKKWGEIAASAYEDYLMTH